MTSTSSVFRCAAPGANSREPARPPHHHRPCTGLEAEPASVVRLRCTSAGQPKPALVDVPVSPSSEPPAVWPLPTRRRSSAGGTDFHRGRGGAVSATTADPDPAFPRTLRAEAAERLRTGRQPCRTTRTSCFASVQIGQPDAPDLTGAGHGADSSTRSRFERRITPTRDTPNLVDTRRYYRNPISPDLLNPRPVGRYFTCP